MKQHVEEYLLDEYVEGTLSDAEAKQVRQHLEECPRCKAEEEEIRSLLVEIQALSSSIPESDLWPAIALELGVTPVEERQDSEDVSDHFLETLGEMIALRHMSSSQELIEKNLDHIVSLGPGTRNAAPLLGYFARWLQMGFANKQLIEESPYVNLLKEALNRFPRTPRPNMSIRDVAHLHIVEGFLLLHEAQYEEAIRRFQFVISLDAELGDRDQIATAYFSIAKAYRRQGAYDKALHYVNLAIDVARAANRVEMAAGFSVMFAWLVFQHGESKQAKELLREAHKALRDSDDYLRQGNIQSAFGRIVQRDGKYSEALDYFHQALALFQKWRLDHANVARTLVNLAFVKILIAQRAARRARPAPLDPTSKGSSKSVSLRRFPKNDVIDQLRSEADDHLAEAQGIYERQHNTRGLGSVRLTYALLYLGQKKIENAASAATAAYELGAGKADQILMVRSRILSSMVEIALCDAEADEGGRPGSHAERARTFSEEAIEHASKTENKRLLARAQTWLAIAYLHESSENVSRAEELWREAGHWLKVRGNDYALEDLQLLERMLDEAREGRSTAAIAILGVSG